MWLNLEFIDSISYGTWVLIWIGVVIVTVAIFGFVAWRASSFKNDDILTWINEPIGDNSYFEEEFERYCQNTAKKAYLLRKVENKDVFYEKFRQKVIPMIFAYEYDDVAKDTDVYFSSMFRNYVVSLSDNIRVGQFYRILRDYVNSRRQRIVPQEHISEEFERQLSDHIIYNVMSNWVDTDDITEDASIDTEAEDEAVMLKRQLRKASYNLAVRDIKLHNNKGILPVLSEYIKPRFLTTLCDAKIYTPKHILSMHESGDISFCVKGCYIVFNTYNNKIFVGRSDDMFSRVYSFLRDDDCKGCNALKSDIKDGDLVLVKFIPFADSDYPTIEHMQKVLILAYDCRGDKGYNKDWRLDNVSDKTTGNSEG